MDRVSDTVVTVELTFDGTDFDTDATLTFTVGANAIAEYNGSPLTAQIAVAASIESETAEDDDDQQPDPPEQSEELVLTARFAALPVAHDGSEFTFELHFSEEIEISYVNVRDEILDVTGGTVTGARRLQAGSNLGWNITIEPDADAEVLIVLPPTDDCEAAGAVCTEDGRPLSNELTATVPGPAAKPVVAPRTFGLDANYPNPFNAQTQLVYTLPMAGPVELAIYNVMGQRVRTLVQDVQAAGRHQIAWDGRRDHGTTLASGVYLSRLVSDQGVQVRRLLLLK